VVVGRSKTKTAAVADPLGARWFVADYAKLDDVRRLAAELQAAYPRIDVLANNAGGVMGRRELTVDGFEKTFQVNHLAPFLLTSLLMPTLLASSASVLQTSSVAAKRYGGLDIDDLQNARSYSPNRAYGNAKLANILFTTELHRRYHEQGLSAAAFHPGVVATNFASESTSIFRLVYRTPLRRLLLVDAGTGATRLSWLALGTPGQSWTSGAYYERNGPARSNPQADDPDLARRLWGASEQLLDL
jgi:NAD(P)-dependent dehydrogenase (short-subunit alcohol dehydrogenase family)